MAATFSKMVNPSTSNVGITETQIEVLFKAALAQKNKMQAETEEISPWEGDYAMMINLFRIY
jgi:hypothetical protein